MLFEELKTGLRVTADKEGIKPDTIGIDTWGVDFVYIGEDGSILSLPRSYRDPYTDDIPNKYFKLLTRKEVYGKTGIH